MTGRGLVLSVGVALVAAAVASARVNTAAAQTNVGAMRGRVRLAGQSPDNAVIRMGLNPMCVKANAGQRVIQEEMVTSAEAA